LCDTPVKDPRPARYQRVLRLGVCRRDACSPPLDVESRVDVMSIGHTGHLTMTGLAAVASPATRKEKE